MFTKCQLRAVDLRCFGMVSVNVAINLMPRSSHVLEPGNCKPRTYHYRQLAIAIIIFRVIIIIIIVIIHIIREQFKSVYFDSFSIRALGIFSSSCNNFLEICASLSIDQQHCHFLIPKLSIIAIFTIHNIFFCRNKAWTNPDLFPPTRPVPLYCFDFHLYTYLYLFCYFHCIKFIW